MKPGGGRAKGAGFELDVAWYFSHYWWGTPRAIRRTPMSGGWSKTSAGGDLISEVDPFPFSVECKFSVAWHFGELFNKGWGELGSYWEQCKGDATRGKIPLLVFKGNGTAIYCMFPTNRFEGMFEARHGRAHSVDKDDLGVTIVPFRTDFLTQPLNIMFETAIAHWAETENWERFQLMRARAMKEFPPKDADAAFMAKA
jgi:hypothetical protein